MSRVLLLNLDYEPLNICELSRAMKLLIVGKADILHGDDSNLIYSGGGDTFIIPKVIRLKHNVKRKHLRDYKVSRVGVFSRDNYTCQYCGDNLNVSECTIDHVVPISKGGRTTWHNVVTACYPCNNSKGNNPKIRPKVEPEMPDYWMLATNRKKKNWQVPHESWLNYIDG